MEIGILLPIIGIAILLMLSGFFSGSETAMTAASKARMLSREKEGDTRAGLGPVVTYGPAVQNNLLNMIIKVAEDNEVPLQRNAASRSTGTDTDAFAYSNAGVASALISLPLKYMHTTVETAHQEDIENTINLFVHFLKQLEAGHDFRYLK